ncbi:hypothetical protein PT974_07269 [Cladobotryum mycophilum]|uniref:Uncharacterized protein n=1 Tax=Cladobotryum mycophilum TaxID=491253 RepID=A0ABR0SNW0_9HYPO
MSLASILNPENSTYLAEGDDFPLYDPTFGFISEDRNFGDWNELAADFDTRPQDVLANAIHGVQDGIGQWALSNAQFPDNVEYGFPTQSIEQYGNLDHQVFIDNVQAMDQVDVGMQNDMNLPFNLPTLGSVVCYGMIHHVEVKLDGDGSYLLQELTQPGSSRNDFRTFNLKSQSDYILLSFNSGNRFGCLRGNMNRALEGLLKESELEFEAVALASKLCKEIPSFDKPKNAIVHVDINIYGPANKSDMVGEVLTEHKLWLQTPDYYKKQYPYDNPHFICFPDEEELMQVDVAQPERSNPQPRTENDVMQLMTEVNNSTNRAQNLERVIENHMVRTKLLDHQQEALSFMLQRESGNITEKFRLWEPKVIEGREM